MNFRNIVIGIGALVLAVLVTMALVNNRENTNTNNENQVTTPPPTTPPPAQLTSTGKIYTSDKLGITFTYDSKPTETFEVTVTERDNKIYVHGTNEQLELAKSIEVFTKDTNINLAEAIRLQFLRNYSAQDCFVEEIPRDPSDPRPASYVFAEIAYPPPTEPNQPFWQNSSKCPIEYSRTNAVQYFMMNQDVHSKFLFIKLGQDSITTDGRAGIDPQQQMDWSASIRIIK